MYCPHRSLRVLFHRLRGTKIGKNVFIAPEVFIEEARPDLVTIEENVDISPRVTILTHDSSYNHISPDVPVLYAKVKISKNVYIGANAVILPGVTIGEGSIVAAGAVVTKDALPHVVVAGVPAKVIKNVDEELRRFKAAKKNNGL